jgi:hypothetical protein
MLVEEEQEGSMYATSWQVESAQHAVSEAQAVSAKVCNQKAVNGESFQ